MALKIGGIHQSSLIDFPGKICCVVFLSKCDFRCGFCHNENLVNDSVKGISKEEFFSFLDKRKGLLDGVCISGGEPLLNPELPEFIKEIREKGFLVKVDTNGNHPEMLSELIKEGFIDYISMDIKTHIDDYHKVTKTNINKDRIGSSIELIRNSGLDYEFRTTVIPKHHNDDEMIAIGKMLKGSKRFVIQQFNPKHCMDHDYKQMKPHVSTRLDEFKRLLNPFFEEVEIKNL